VDNPGAHQQFRYPVVDSVGMAVECHDGFRRTGAATTCAGEVGTSGDPPAASRLRPWRRSVERADRW